MVKLKDCVVDTIFKYHLTDESRSGTGFQPARERQMPVPPIELRAATV